MNLHIRIDITNEKRKGRDNIKTCFCYELRLRWSGDILQPTDKPLFQMNFHLTDEHKMIRELARDFADKEVRPLAKEIDASGNVPAALIEKMAKLGFMGVAVPEEFGGAGMDTVSLVIAMEEIARACAAKFLRNG